MLAYLRMARPIGHCAEARLACGDRRYGSSADISRWSRFGINRPNMYKVPVGRR